MTHGPWVYLTVRVHNSGPLEWDFTTSFGAFHDFPFSCPVPPRESAAPLHEYEAYFNLMAL